MTVGGFQVKKYTPSNVTKVRLTVLAYVELGDRNVYNREAGIDAALASVKPETTFGEVSIPISSAIPIF